MAVGLVKVPASTDIQGLVDASGQTARMLRLAHHCRGWFPLPFTKLLRGEGHLGPIRPDTPTWRNKKGWYLWKVPKLIFNSFCILPILPVMKRLIFLQEISGMPQLEMLDLPSLGHWSPCLVMVVNFAQKPFKGAWQDIFFWSLWWVSQISNHEWYRIKVQEHVQNYVGLSHAKDLACI